MKIIHVPIERVPTRYTADWVDQFESEFKEAGVDFVTVEGEANEISIQNGSVLDCFGTNIYKSQQIIKILQMIQNKEITEEDVIFFADLWFPGLESLFYVRNITGIDFKITGILHAGSYDPFDFTSRTGMRNWAQHLENAWLNEVDAIFVATQFHKDMIIMDSGEFDYNKIFVTGIPFYSEELLSKYPVSKKEDIVVFPHRLDEEKQPEKFETLRRKFPQWKFVKTMDYCANRTEYFELLARSKVMVSFAKQETFGYSTVEAMALGNFVIVPNRLSYRETVPDGMRYDKDNEVAEMLKQFMSMEDSPFYPDLVKWESSVPKMIRVMQVKLKEAANRRKSDADLVRQDQIRREEEKQARRERLAEKKSEMEVAVLTLEKLNALEEGVEVTAIVIKDFAENFSKGQFITLRKISETDVIVDNVANIGIEFVANNCAEAVSE